MNAPSSVSALTNALVHQSAMASPVERASHGSFIARRLAIAFAALAVAPFFLAFHGAPTTAESVVFACSFAPLAAGVLAARTGRLAAAHGIACLGLVALSLSLLGLGCGIGCVVAWLVAAQLEASLSGDRRIVHGAAAACGLTLGGVLTSSAWLATSVTASATTAVVFSGLALAYAIIVAFGIERVAEVGVAIPRLDDLEIGRAASEMIEDLVIGFDTDGSVVRARIGHETRLVYDAPDLMGRGFFQHVHVGDRPAFLKLVADAAYDDEPRVANIRLRLPQGPRVDDRPLPPRHVRIKMVAKRLGSDSQAPQRPCAVVAVLRDVDAAQAHDVEIEAAQSSLEEAVRSKDHFLANMSHELRTPLNAIIGFSEMLASHTLRPADADKQREYARIIQQSGQHLLSVVNSILDMSKIRSGTFAIVPEAFDIIPLLDLACDMIALKAQDGRVAVVRDYPDALEEFVGDKRACKQILINLLSNAVKFTPEHGSVTLSARPEGTALVIAVSDTGIGIGVSDLARLGDPFFQARSSFSRPFEGTGLGLSVVRGLVGLHGGTIAIESELGRGTHVTIRLPLDCRTINQTATSATIETLARRQPTEPRLGHLDRRMKQIA